MTKTTEVAETKNESSLESECPNVRTYVRSLGVSAVPIIHPAWVKFNSFLYKKYAYVYLGNGELYPKFGKIVDLFTFHTDSVHVHVYIQECDTLYFSSHFNAFVVKVLPTYTFCNIHSLPSYPILHAHRSFNKSASLYIVMKQYVCVND